MGRKILSLIMGIVFALSFSSCNYYEIDNRIQKQEYVIEMKAERNTEEDSYEVELIDLNEKDLLSIFKDKNDDNVINRYYGDFDHDSKREMFVTTGEVLEASVGVEPTVYGKLWLVNSSGVCLVAEDFTGMSELIDIWRFDDRDYLVAKKNYVTGNRTYLWSVSNGTPIKSSVSGIGDIRYDEEGLKVYDSFIGAYEEDGENKGLVTKSYDMGYSGGSFFEFGGISMPQSEFLKYDGADEILSMLSIDYPDAYFSILYHSNNVIYINITNKVENKTMNNAAIVSIEGDSVSLDTVNEGHYDSALLKEIAIYPSRFDVK